jgi:hypothetical protein
VRRRRIAWAPSVSPLTGHSAAHRRGRGQLDERGPGSHEAELGSAKSVEESASELKSADVTV